MIIGYCINTEYLLFVGYTVCITLNALLVADLYRMVRVVVVSVLILVSSIYIGISLLY